MPLRLWISTFLSCCALACGGTVAAQPASSDAGSPDDAQIDVHAEAAADAGVVVTPPPPRDPVQCAGGGSISFDKSCSKDADCVVVTVYLGCCHSDALGCNAGAATGLADAGAACGRLDPCDCAGNVVTADDGQVVAGGGQSVVHVACVAGLCESSKQ